MKDLESTNVAYLKGDVTIPQATGNKIIAHICNDVGGWGRGFVLAISARWEEPEAQYRRWHKQGSESNFALGGIQLVQVEPDLWVANMIGQHDIVTHQGVPPIRYEAVELCLRKLAIEARKLAATIHMPRIGCGLAGGSWDKIEPLIQAELSAQGIPVYVYDPI